ncbi:MAG: NAD(P)-dependent oxidoreductase [Candidatus Rokubacteria bacterium]|nr:NAD(P)-dependent oxidoreductase [Candidatus Rokubacteria bacterium]
MASLGFVGLGAMGAPMARRLLAAGHRVAGYNRTPAKAVPLVPLGLEPVSSPRLAAAAAEAIFSMVTDSAALAAVARGPDGIIAGLRPGAVWAEMSTVSPETTRALGAEVAARGAVMLDAPVSGSSITVEQGQLAFFVGGPAEALDRIRPYLLAIGPTITHVGALGLAVTMKVATNLAIAVQLVTFAEQVLLAEKAGITRERAVEALLRSVVASPMLRYRGPFVLRPPAEPLFNVAMMQKDVELALDLGRATGTPLPTTALAHEVLAAALGLGLEPHDCAAVFDVLARLAGRPGSIS